MISAECAVIKVIATRMRSPVLRQHLLVCAVLSAAGFAAYASVLGTFFVADDFAYLDAIRTSSSPRVIFSPLAGRYFRPMVMFVYYGNWLLSHTNPWTYHVSVVLIHVCNGWLVYLLGRRLFPERDLLAILSALLFLVFGGHAEAITWIGGMADPLLTLFLLIGLLSFMSALDRPRPVLPLLGAWAAFGAAVFSKESSAVFPAIAIAALLLRRQVLQREHLQRVLIFLVPIVVMSVAYVALRRHVLGFSLVTLEGLGTATSPLYTFRSFFIRCFAPQGPLLLAVFAHRLDLVAWVAVLTGCLAGVFWPQHRRLTFLTVCLWLALAPVLPLSIGMSSTDSERLIYLPSAFACLLIVSLADAVLRNSWIVVAATSMFGAWHVVALQAHNDSWKAASMMTAAHTAAFGATVRAQALSGEPIFMLNLPDNVNSAFVWRRGFHEALRVMNPDQLEAIARTFVVSIVNVNSSRTRATVTQESEAEYSLHLTSGAIINESGTTPYFTTTTIDASTMRVNFTGYAGRGLVLNFTPYELVTIGRVAGGPFGNIDLPQGPAICGQTNPSVMGWALADDGVARVVLALEHTESASAPIEIGEASRGPRPDVTTAMPYFPDSQAPGWSATVPCERARAEHGPVRLVIIAENRRGQRARLGTRDVTAAP
jgi:hypothetical protein